MSVVCKSIDPLVTFASGNVGSVGDVAMLDYENVDAGSYLIPMSAPSKRHPGTSSYPRMRTARGGEAIYPPDDYLEEDIMYDDNDDNSGAYENPFGAPEMPFTAETVPSGTTTDRFDPGNRSSNYVPPPAEEGGEEASSENMFRVNPDSVSALRMSEGQKERERERSRKRLEKSLRMIRERAQKRGRGDAFEEQVVERGGGASAGPEDAEVDYEISRQLEEARKAVAERNELTSAEKRELNYRRLTDYMRNGGRPLGGRSVMRRDPSTLGLTANAINKVAMGVFPRDRLSGSIRPRPDWRVATESDDYGPLFDADIDESDFDQSSRPIRSFSKRRRYS